MRLARIASFTPPWTHISLRHMASTPSTPQPNPPPPDLAAPLRHSLYALLREIRRLPDAASRIQLRSQAFDRYRAGRDASNERLRSRFRRVQKDLTYLRKANEGYSLQVLKVLMLTYGRVGRRRRELLAPLMRRGDEDDQPLVPGGEEGDERVRLRGPTERDPILKALPSIHPDHVGRVPVLPPVLKTLLRSQMQVMNPILPNTHRVKSLGPDVPTVNAWQRPMPQKRQVNFAKSHYKSLLQKTLPPLPGDEWERLRRLALGIEKPDLAGNKGNAENEDGGGARGDGEVSDLEDSLRERQDLQNILKQEKDILGGGTTKPHHLTARFMRRLYVQVFEKCPRLDWDETVKPPRWNVTWGREALKQGRMKGRTRMQDLATVLDSASE